MSMSARRVWSFGLAAFVASVFNALPAQAANIRIIDVAPDDTITIAWADFEGGFVVNGNFHPFLGFGVEESETLSEQFPIVFRGDWIASTFGQGSTDVTFLEPDGSGAVSDVFHGTYGGGGGENFATINGGFQSDTEGTPLLSPPGAFFLIEDGTAQEISQLLQDLPSNLTIQVQSDISDVQTVPEPGSLLLLGTGLVVAARQWRKRQPKA